MSCLLQNLINIYRPTASALQLLDTQEFTTPVQSASLYTQEGSISMLAITESAGTLIPYVLELQLFFQPASVRHGVLVRDPLLQCISKLEADLKNRRILLQDVVSQRKLLLHKKSPGVFSGKLIVQKVGATLSSNRIVDLTSNLNYSCTVTFLKQL